MSENLQSGGEYASRAMRVWQRIEAQAGLNPAWQVATFIAVYGFLMPPLGWSWAGFVWGYALTWALLTDRIKLIAYRIFDPVKTKPKPGTKVEPMPTATS